MYTQALEGFSVGTQRICVIFTLGQPVLLLFKKREREKKKKKKTILLNSDRMNTAVVVFAYFLLKFRGI